MAVRRAVHRVKNHPDPRRTGSDQTLHRHGGRRVQRRVVAGTAPARIARRIHHRVDPDSRAAPPARFPRRRPRRDFQHERGLYDGRHSEAERAGVSRHDERCERGNRGGPTGTGFHLAGVARSSNSGPPVRQRHPFHHARLSARRHRHHLPLHARTAEPAHLCKTEPDPART